MHCFRNVLTYQGIRRLEQKPFDLQLEGAFTLTFAPNPFALTTFISNIGRDAEPSV